MAALQISPKIERADMPQKYKGLYGILQLLQGSHLDNFLLKTLGWVAFHVLIFRFSI